MQYDFTATGNSTEVIVAGDSNMAYHVDFTTGSGAGTVQWQMQMDGNWIPVADAIAAHMDIAKVLDCPTGKRQTFRMNCSAYTTGTITVTTS